MSPYKKKLLKGLNLHYVFEFLFGETIKEVERNLKRTNVSRIFLEDKSNGEKIKKFMFPSIFLEEKRRELETKLYLFLIPNFLAKLKRFEEICDFQVLFVYIIFLFSPTCEHKIKLQIFFLLVVYSYPFLFFLFIVDNKLLNLFCD